jgi:adenylate kinase
MKILFIGAQGSGKGTQAAIISKILGIPHISTGDIFRSLTGELKHKIDSIINQGNLVPDDLTLEILKKRLEHKDCKSGFILDGFPRNLNQANLLEKIIKIDKVIEIHISDNEAIKRISGRVSCEKCKKGYNIITEPKPKNLSKCDICNGKLIQRADDNPDAVKKRLNTYHQETEPILKKYKSVLIKINGEQKIEDITKENLKKNNS